MTIKEIDTETSGLISGRIQLSKMGSNNNLYINRRIERIAVRRYDTDRFYI